MQTHFQNARVVADNVLASDYMNCVGEDGKPIRRGDPNFVMTRSSSLESAECMTKWLRGEPHPDTDATEWGTWIDDFALSPARAATKFVIAPVNYPCEPTKKDLRTEKPWNKNANYCSEWEDAHEKAGRVVLKQKEFDKIQTAMAVLKADKQIWELIECSKKQVLIVGEYHDVETGVVVPVKALVDLVPDKTHPRFGRSLADFKTTISANQFLWATFVRKRNYHVQAAFHMDLYVSATGEDRFDWLHPIQENKHPYETGRRFLDQKAIALGRIKYQNALRAYCKFLKTGVAKGYDPENDWSCVEADPAMEADAMRSIPEIEIPPEDGEDAESVSDQDDIPS